MMRKYIIALRLIFLFGFITVATAASLIAQQPDEKESNSLAKETYDPTHYACLNINNLWMWQREDGHSGHSPAGHEGCYYPRRTSHVIYQDGIVWGAKAYADASHTQPAPFGQTIRVGGASYGTGCRAGWVEGFGATAVQVSRDDPRARIWRIRRDYKLVWERYMMGDPWATAVVLDDASTCWEIPVGEVDNDQVEITFPGNA